MLATSSCAGVDCTVKDSVGVVVAVTFCDGCGRRVCWIQRTQTASRRSTAPRSVPRRMQRIQQMIISAQLTSQASPTARRWMHGTSIPVRFTA